MAFEILRSVSARDPDRAINEQTSVDILIHPPVEFDKRVTDLIQQAALSEVGEERQPSDKLTVHQLGRSAAAQHVQVVGSLYTFRGRKSSPEALATAGVGLLELYTKGLQEADSAVLVEFYKRVDAAPTQSGDPR